VVSSSYGADGFIDFSQSDSSPYSPNKRILFSLSTNDLCYKKISSINFSNETYPLNTSLRTKISTKFDIDKLKDALKKQGLKITRLESLSSVPVPSSDLRKKNDGYLQGDNINKRIQTTRFHLQSIATLKNIVITLSSKQQQNKKILNAFKNTSFYYHNALKNTFYNEKAKHIMTIPSACNKQLNISSKDFHEPSGRFNIILKKSFKNSITFIAQSTISSKRKNKKGAKTKAAVSSKKADIKQQKIPPKADFKELEFVFSERPFLQNSLRAKFLEEGTKITHISSAKELTITANKKLVLKFPLDEKTGDKISIDNPDYSIIDSKIETDADKTIINTIVRDNNDEILIVYYPLDPTTSYRSKIADDTAKLMNFEFSSFLSKFKDQYSKVYYRMREEGPLNEFKEKASLGHELLMSNDELRDNVEFNWSDTSIYYEIKQMNESSQVFHIIYFTGKNEPDLVRIFNKAPNARVYAIQFETNTHNMTHKDVNEFLHLHKFNYHNVSTRLFKDIFNSQLIIKYFRGQK